MLKTKVILSQVSNLSDARYASGMGVDYIGFSIDPGNSQYVTVEEVKSISDWLAGVNIIGEVGNTIPSDINDYNLSSFITSNIDLVDDLKNPILLFEVTIENINEQLLQVKKYSRNVGFIILEIEGGQLAGLQTQLSELCGKHNIYLSTNFDEHSLALVINNIKPEGIVLYGSTEEKPGLSSYDGIADILEQLELD